MRERKTVLLLFIINPTPYRNHKHNIIWQAVSLFNLQLFWYNMLKMINIETVFIIGAGASQPYKYPTGDELHDLICHKFPSELQAILGKAKIPDREQTGQMNAARELSRRFRASHTASIDLWLSNNTQYLDIGKLAIANSIIKAEMQSNLFFDDRLKEKGQDWFTFLFNEMITNELGNSPLQHFRFNKAYFVTFNYDRLLEQLIYSSLVNSFCDTPEDEIKERLFRYPIYHVYGCIDDFPWAQMKYPYGILPFYNKEFVEYACERIKIVNEERKMADDLSDIKLILENAKRVFFLGFGYDTVNMQRLGLPNSIKNVGRIYGTGYGLSKHQIENRKLIFEKVCNLAQIHIEDCNCRELLQNFL
jgi:hypothetical protein